MKHFLPALFTGAVIAAVVWADGGSPLTTVIVGALVAAVVLVAAYLVDRRR